jgi:hypothetical protein
MTPRAAPGRGCPLPMYPSKHQRTVTNGKHVTSNNLQERPHPFPFVVIEIIGHGQNTTVNNANACIEIHVTLSP